MATLDTVTLDYRQNAIGTVDELVDVLPKGLTLWCQAAALRKRS